MVSFQCSPLATAEGIQSVFKVCARYQTDKKPETFVSVVVLDEVGLAEDSPRMALKVRCFFSANLSELSSCWLVHFHAFLSPKYHVMEKKYCVRWFYVILIAASQTRKFSQRFKYVHTVFIFTRHCIRCLKRGILEIRDLENMQR
jgi:hypothetical protein